MNGGPFLDGVALCIEGATGGAAAANGCTYTTQAGGSVWNGSHVLTQLKLNNFTGFGTCSSNCGNIELACGGSLPGHSPAPCHVNGVIQHATPAPDVGIPGYVFSAAFALLACQNTPWAAGSQHGTHDEFWASGHCFYVTNIVTTGNVGFCSSGSTLPIAGATSDGNCTISDLGASAGYPQETATGTGYLPGGGMPATGVVNINGPAVCTGSINCTQAQVATGLPIPWERPFIYWMALFNACYDGDTVPCTGAHTGNPGIIAHYAGVSWAADSDYQRIGCNVGGECYTFAASAIQTAFGFTNDTAGHTQFISEWAWGAQQAYLANATTWKALNPPWALGANMNECDNGCGTLYQNLPNALAAYAVSDGYSLLGFNGLQQTDLTSTVAAGYPCAQATPASNGYICVAATYHLQVKYIQVQTDGDSAGPGSPTTPPGSCSTIQTNTGTVANLWPWATQHWLNAAEPYATDISVMADSNYVASTTYGSGCTPYLGATPNSYSIAIGNLSNGVPSSTSGLGGKAGRGGHSGQN